VGLGCGGSTSRGANSPDDENNEEINEAQNEESDRPAEADSDNEDGDTKAEAHSGKKRRPPKRKHRVEAASAKPEQELPPMYKKPSPPPPPEPLPEEEPAPAALNEPAENGTEALEAEARRRCHWKNVAPYHPEWASSLSPPLAPQKKITSKPVCSYGTSPAVLRVARQIAVEQTKLKKK
jgi:hypothetical protein